MIIIMVGTISTTWSSEQVRW